SPPIGSGLPSIKATRAGLPLSRSFCSRARHSRPTAMESTRRLMVEGEGRRRGLSVVVLQWRGWQAQQTGRSCRAAQSKTATRAQDGCWTYFWEKSLAVSLSKWYKGGQSSRSMIHLLEEIVPPLEVNHERELLTSQHLPATFAKCCLLGNA